MGLLSQSTPASRRLENMPSAIDIYADEVNRKAKSERKFLNRRDRLQRDLDFFQQEDLIERAKKSPSLPIEFDPSGQTFGLKGEGMLPVAGPKRATPVSATLPTAATAKTAGEKFDAKSITEAGSDENKMKTAAVGRTDEESPVSQPSQPLGSNGSMLTQFHEGTVMPALDKLKKDLKDIRNRLALTGRPSFEQGGVVGVPAGQDPVAASAIGAGDNVPAVIDGQQPAKIQTGERIASNAAQEIDPTLAPHIDQANAEAQVATGGGQDATSGFAPVFSQQLRASAPQSGSVEDIKANIFANSPVLAQYDFDVEQVDRLHPQFDPTYPQGAAIEFLPAGETGDPRFPEEEGNPSDKPLLRLYSNVSRDPAELQNAVFGDLLHNLAMQDPAWRELRQMYIDNRSQDAIETDERVYEQLVKDGVENRPFEQWMDVSRADAHIRGPLTGNEEWMRHQTPEQNMILEAMQNYLATGTLETPQGFACGGVVKGHKSYEYGGIVKKSPTLYQDGGVVGDDYTQAEYDRDRRRRRRIDRKFDRAPVVETKLTPVPDALATAVSPEARAELEAGMAEPPPPELSDFEKSEAYARQTLPPEAFEPIGVEPEVAATATPPPEVDMFKGLDESQRIRQRLALAPKEEHIGLVSPVTGEPITFYTSPEDVQRILMERENVKNVNDSELVHAARVLGLFDMRPDFHTLPREEKERILLEATTGGARLDVARAAYGEGIDMSRLPKDMQTANTMARLRSAQEIDTEQDKELRRLGLNPLDFNTPTARRLAIESGTSQANFRDILRNTEQGMFVNSRIASESLPLLQGQLAIAKSNLEMAGGGDYGAPFEQIYLQTLANSLDSLEADEKVRQNVIGLIKQGTPVSSAQFMEIVDLLPKDTQSVLLTELAKAKADLYMTAKQNERGNTGLHKAVEAYISKQNQLDQAMIAAHLTPEVLGTHQMALDAMLTQYGIPSTGIVIPTTLTQTPSAVAATGSERERELSARVKAGDTDAKEELFLLRKTGGAGVDDSGAAAKTAATGGAATKPVPPDPTAKAKQLDQVAEERVNHLLVDIMKGLGVPFESDIFGMEPTISEFGLGVKRAIGDVDEDMAALENLGRQIPSTRPIIRQKLTAQIEALKHKRDMASIQLASTPEPTVLQSIVTLGAAGEEEGGVGSPSDIQRQISELQSILDAF